jgi:hypothetical protein
MTTPFPFVSGAVLTAAQLNAITTLPISAKTANYTLAVGDVGYRIQMTNAGSTTITVNTGIFAAGDTIWIQNMGAGTCTITAGTATVSTASSLALAQYGGGTLVFQSASAATFFSQVAATYGTATGGSSSSITVSGTNYTLLSFLSDATLTVSKSGYFDVVMVAGGGGGGRGAYGGGGGGGGVVQSTIYLAATTYAVTVGAGGTGTVTREMSGFGRGSEIAGVLTAAGGGAVNYNLADGMAGGSGGGGASGAAGTAGPAIAGSQGKNGGTQAASAAGGGGGYSATGANGSGTTGGAGGTGLQLTTFTGSTITTWIGCGGGGAASVTQGAGGNSTGGTAGATGGNATTNSGSGGGGSFTSTTAGGNGSAGAVYIRFKS